MLGVRIQAGEDNKDNEIKGNIKNVIEWNKTDKDPQIHESIINYILDPSIHIGVSIHDSQFDASISEIEADLVEQIILGYYLMVMPDFSTTAEEDLKKAERDFWTNKLGVVSPHNAQGRLLIRKVYLILTRNQINYLPENETMDLIKNTIYSVEKFQGSARDFIISSMGISSLDKLIAEEEFLYNINRFNVLSSRARSKFVFIYSRNFLNYMPKERELLNNSYKFRHFSYDICNEVEKFQLNDNDFEFRYKLSQEENLDNHPPNAGYVYVCQKCDKSYRSVNLLQKNLNGEFICPEDGTILDKYKRIF